MISNLLPFCHSSFCTKAAMGTKPALKTVNGFPINCPDCGSALVWARSRAKMRHFSSTRTSTRINTGVIR